MELQPLAMKLAACLGGVNNITGMESGKQLLHIYVAHLEYVDIQKLQAAPFVQEAFLNRSSVILSVREFKADEVKMELQLLEADTVAADDEPAIASPQYVRHIITPLLSTILAAGILQTLIVLTLSFGLFNISITTNDALETVFSLMYLFLPVMVAFSSGRYHKTNPYIASLVAGVMLQPTVIEFVSMRILGGFLDFPLINHHQYNTLIPILVLIRLMASLNRLLDKTLPGLLRPYLRPVLLLGFGLVVGIFFLLPIMAMVSYIAVKIMIYLVETVPVIAVTLMGFFGPIFILTGTHYSFFDNVKTALQTTGYDVLLGPGILATNAAHAGVALAVAMKSRKKLYRIYSGLSFGMALLGVAQPVMYGVEIILKRPFLYAMIGGGVGGLVAGIFDLRSYALVNPSLASILTFSDVRGNMLVAASCMLVAGMVSFILTWTTKFTELTDEEIHLAATGQGLDMLK